VASGEILLDLLLHSWIGFNDCFTIRRFSSAATIIAADMFHLTSSARRGRALITCAIGATFASAGYPRRAGTADRCAGAVDIRTRLVRVVAQT
jgi:hypothetical protein